MPKRITHKMFLFLIQKFILFIPVAVVVSEYDEVLTGRQTLSSKCFSRFWLIDKGPLGCDLHSTEMIDFFSVHQHKLRCTVQMWLKFGPKNYRILFLSYIKLFTASSTDFCLQYRTRFNDELILPLFFAANLLITDIPTTRKAWSLVRNPSIFRYHMQHSSLRWEGKVKALCRWNVSVLRSKCHNIKLQTGLFQNKLIFMHWFFGWWEMTFHQLFGFLSCIKHRNQPNSDAWHEMFWIISCEKLWFYCQLNFKVQGFNVKD